MKKEITTKQIQKTKEQLELLIGELLDRYESMVPMVIEKIELGEDEETGKNVVIVHDFLNFNADMFIKPEK